MVVFGQPFVPSFAFTLTSCHSAYFHLIRTMIARAYTHIPHSLNCYGEFAYFFFKGGGIRDGWSVKMASRHDVVSVKYLCSKWPSIVGKAVI